MTKLKKTLAGIGIAASLATTAPVFEAPYVFENVTEDNTVVDILNENIIDKTSVDEAVVVNCVEDEKTEIDVPENIQCETVTVKDLLKKVQKTEEARKDKVILPLDQLLTASEYIETIKLYNIEIHSQRTNLINKIIETYGKNN